MAGVYTGRRVTCALTTILLLSLLAPRAGAIEAFEGRIQAHGFVEMQIRALDADFAEEIDLAQWYNVLNIELEFDILPDGWGPFDLLQAYVRAEGRYDCIYSRGCGMFPSVNTFGDKSEDLPLRLRDAIDQDYGGVIDTSDSAVPPGPDVRRVPAPRDPTPWVIEKAEANPDYDPLRDADPNEHCVLNASEPDYPTGRQDTCLGNRPEEIEVDKRRGFPGFDTVFDIPGADNELGDQPDYDDIAQPVDGVEGMDEAIAELVASGPVTAQDLRPLFRGLARKNDDPAFYTFGPVLDWRFTFRETSGPDGGTGTTGLMGPWLPKNFFRSLATLHDRANPLRARRSPTILLETELNAFLPARNPMREAGNRYHELDVLNGTGPASDPDGPQNPNLFNPLTDCDAGPCPYPADPVDATLLKLQQLTIAAQDLQLDIGNIAWERLGPYGNMLDPRGNFVFSEGFGGDFSGIIPCFDPRAIKLPNTPSTFLRSDYVLQVSGPEFGGRFFDNPDCVPYTNLRVSGGGGESPMRVAPDRSNLLEPVPGLAQGLYIPSRGLIDALASQDFDQHEFNISEIDRAFNRGASQSDTYELKEAYLDMEFLDSRLWIRAGIQNIVWGKTELFRTTDQFNPQDLALASLPSLEESRIGLLSARAVYSLYDVGPLQDLRIELAANFDRIKPADLGACGEPYTIDIICGLTLGIALHGMTGVGIAGVDRPPSAWNDIDGIEFGGRIEFRWDRFSFAITDFYGYNDFPYPDPISFYERNVDPNTGRPRKAGATGPCENSAGVLVDINPAPSPFGDLRVLQAGNSRIEFTEGVLPGNEDLRAEVRPTGEVIPDQAYDDYHRRPEAYSPLGIGTDPACLKPGGAPAFPNENRFDTRKAPDPDGFARYSTGTTDPATSNVWAIGDPNVYITTTLGQWARLPTPEDRANGIEGYSVDYSLAHQPANQQLFAFICSATVTIAVSLSPTDCAWNVFGSKSKLIKLPNQPAPTFAEVITTILGGEIHNNIMDVMRVIQQQTKQGAAVGEVAITPLNRDVRDGRTNTNIWADKGGALSQRRFRDFKDFTTMDNSLTMEQKALLGCGPFYGTRCDMAAGLVLNNVPTLGDSNFRGAGGGGIDVLNAEASALLQSFPGMEGTDRFTPFFVPEFVGRTDLYADGVPADGWVDDWVTWSYDAQPGTIGYEGGAYCTRFDPSSEFADELGIVRLPGCRGALSVTINEADSRVEVEFERFYTPRQDGCVFGPSIGGFAVQAVRRNPSTGELEDDDRLQSELEETCFNLDGPSNTAVDQGTNISLVSDHRWADPVPGDPGQGPYLGPTDSRLGARTLYHPFASCQGAGIGTQGTPVWNNYPAESVLCDFRFRTYEQDFLAGNAQVFRSEMAALSWNFLNFLVITSCNVLSGDDLADGDCFDPTVPWAMGRCSFSQPYRCGNVKGFLSVAGVRRNDTRAGGNGRFGRRDFIWHSGGELALRYARRNVFGFSMDFAEDVTKTNWGMEFTWIGKVPFLDNNSSNAVSDSGALNLTISVDRPTFINFLNANRTFFVNSQWFFQYLLDHDSGFTTQGPFNVLFTFAVFTGYYQDRLLPQLVTVYDFRSQSGGFLPSVAYRFTEAFSVTFGVSFFIGRGEFVTMPLQGFAPAANRAGPHAYEDGVEHLLSLIRNRDEAFMRLRWTF
jgi:hypothetical protein